MAQFKCKVCNHEFKSDEPRPTCPRGCRYPTEHGGILTTERIAAPAPPAPPVPQESPQAPTVAASEGQNGAGKRKPGRPPKHGA